MFFFVVVILFILTTLALSLSTKPQMSMSSIFVKKLGSSSEEIVINDKKDIENLKKIFDKSKSILNLNKEITIVGGTYVIEGQDNGVNFTYVVYGDKIHVIKENIEGSIIYDEWHSLQEKYYYDIKEIIEAYLRN